jgi:hypothetical protein
MDARPSTPVPLPVLARRHVPWLGLGAALPLVGLFSSRLGLSSLAIALSGLCTSVTLFHFWLARSRATRVLAGRDPSGRIRVSRGEHGVRYELPADGAEPWGVDAAVSLIATLGAVATIVLLGEPRPEIATLMALLPLLLALRLRTARSDFVRLDLGPDGWAIDAEEGGRPIHRSGRGKLGSRLTPRALLLLSGEERIGSLAGELEAEERRFLADALSEHSAEALDSNAPRSARAQAGDQVDENEAGHERQQEERERDE